MKLRFSQSDDEILKGIDLKVRAGEVILIQGNNGSGKTTLFKAVLQLHRPGTFSIKEGRVLKSKLSVGYLSQRPQTQVLTFSVREELVTPLSFRRVSRSVRRNKIEELSKTYGIVDLLDQDPHRLSSGQQQFIISLVNLSMDADLILLDEPFALLDSENRGLLIDGLRFIKQRGIALIIVSHNIMGLDELVDRSYKLSDGLLRSFTPVYPKPMDPVRVEFRGVPMSLNFLELGYDNPLLLFEDLVLPDRGLVMVNGRNGSGKTLLLLTLGGILKPKRGRIPDWMREDSYLVLQDSHLMFWRPTIREEWYAVSDKAPPSSIEPILDRVPLSLSPGELKLFALTLAFNSGRSVILLDEPNYGLDEKNRTQLVGMIKDNIADRLIILTTNDELLRNDLLRNSSLLLNLEDYRRGDHA